MGPVLFTAGLIAKGLVRRRRSAKAQEDAILAAADRLMLHIVQFLELHASNAEKVLVLGEAEAVLRHPRTRARTQPQD